MSAIIKYLGVLILLIGVVILAVPAFSSGSPSNAVLVTGLAVIIIGYLAHIFLNKRVQ